MKTTLNLIRAQPPCADGWKKLLTHLGKTKADDEPLELLTVLESNGMDDALWTLRCVPNCDRDARLFAVWCARHVQHLMIDKRSLNALDVAERLANGAATAGELNAASAAARAVVLVAARAAYSAAAAARAAYLASAAARGAYSAAAAARAAYLASAAARDAQKSMFIQMCNGTAPWQEGGK